MKLKAIHLLHRLERLDRDLEELQLLQNSIQADRAYARTLKESLMEEFGRLRQLKSRILSQVIRTPPAGLTGEAESSKPAALPNAENRRRLAPELTLPSAKKEKAEPSRTAAATAEPAQKKTAFRFVYDNKQPS